MKCVICGKDFYNKNSKAICCSIECRKKRKSQTASINYKNRKNGIYVKEFESFYNFNVNKIGKELFDKYWDYEANLINPNEISKFSHKKVFIRCIDTHYHGTYEISASVFSKGHRCPYCNTFASGKVHIKDSLGYVYPNIVKFWSSKNKKTPFDYSVGSNEKVWFKCENGKHEDYLQHICNKTQKGCECPKCKMLNTKGELKIKEVLDDKNIKYKREFSFDDLINSTNRKLKFDFAILNFKGKVIALIEYDGEFHYKKHYGSKDDNSLLLQISRDNLKSDYAIKNKIKLIRIPYWEFDNIESILDRELEGVI